MGKALIIAEKPSVAGDIAKALGGFKKPRRLLRKRPIRPFVGGRPFAWADCAGRQRTQGQMGFQIFAGHSPPLRFGAARKNRWPAESAGEVDQAQRRYCLINACDAGREGELIFRNIVRYTKAKQPIQRLWLQSMTPGAIRDGFFQTAHRSGYDSPGGRGLSRSEADWLVGINARRAMTVFNSKSGGFYKTPVGRVKRRHWLCVVEREAKIKKFVPRDIGKSSAHSKPRPANTSANGSTKNLSGPRRMAIPISNPTAVEVSRAESLRDKCLHKPGIVTEESKPRRSFLRCCMI